MCYPLGRGFKLLKPQSRWLIRVAGMILIASSMALLVSTFLADEIFPEHSPAQRGETVAKEAGCFSCHGSGDGRGSVNPLEGPKGTEFRTVPSMTAERHSLQELRQWIENGINDRHRADPNYQQQRQRFVLQMPAYRDQLDKFQIDDLMAYVALRQYRVAAREANSQSDGERLARQYGCFTCHGELGQGGVENPRSLKGYIPGFFGTDFRALTRNGDPEDLHEWIVEGRSEYFWDQGFAGFYPGRFFTERQAIRMPAYRNRMTDGEVDVLVQYLSELMELGPLSAERLIEYRPLSGSQSGVPSNPE